MHRNVRIASFAILFSLSAAPFAVSATAEAPGDVLVWGFGADRRRVTLWLHATEDGFAVRARREGVVLADAISVRRFESRFEPARRPSCEQGAAGVSHGAVAILHALAGGGDERRVARAVVPTERGQYDFDFRAAGQLGTMLLVEERGRVSTCDEPARTTAAVRAIDVRDGSEIPWLTDAERSELTASLGAEARRLIDAELRSSRAHARARSTSSATAASEVRLVSFAPVFHDDGSISARYLFVASTCVECADTDWQSEERGAWVDSDRLPAPVAGMSVPPTVITAAKAALPGVELRGVSYVEGVASALLPHVFASTRR